MNIKRWKIVAEPVEGTALGEMAATVINSDYRTYFFKENAVYDAQKLEWLFNNEITVKAVRNVAT